MNVFKRVAACLPPAVQNELRRIRFMHQVRRGRFATSEPEYLLLDQFLKPGDWAIDVGANVGHYTVRLSELVGLQGRVIAIEPIPATFAVLASVCSIGRCSNVTLLNAAASSAQGVVAFDVPEFDSRLPNYYQARITDGGTSVRTLAIPIDALALSGTVRLVKIDVEGHEFSVLQGMKQLLARDLPVLIVEGNEPEVNDYLSAFGYRARALPNSSNTLYSATRT